MYTHRCVGSGVGIEKMWHDISADADDTVYRRLGWHDSADATSSYYEVLYDLLYMYIGENGQCMYCYPNR